MLFLDKKNIRFFNGLPKTRIQHSRSCFVTCNFHTAILNIDKNVDKDYWGDNDLNKRLVLPLLDQCTNSFDQFLNATMNGREKNTKDINNRLKYKKSEKENKQRKFEKKQ